MQVVQAPEQGTIDNLSLSTNREVADRLFLSPHTVNSHLRHIFAKLAINSRTELARIVAEQDATSLRR